MARRPAAGGPHRMGWMHGAGKQHGLAGGDGIEQPFIGYDEGLLSVVIELARDDLRPVPGALKAMQECDQSRAAFMGEAEPRADKGPDLACRAGQRRADPGLQLRLLAAAHLASAAARLKPRQPVKTAGGIKPMPLPDRIIIHKQSPSHPLATPARIRQHQRIGAARASQCAAEPSRASAFRSRQSSGERKRGRIIPQVEPQNHRTANLPPFNFLKA